MTDWLARCDEILAGPCTEPPDWAVAEARLYTVGEHGEGPWGYALVELAQELRGLLSERSAREERLRDAIEGFLLNEYPEGVPPESHAAHLQALTARQAPGDARPHEDFLTQEELES